MIRFWSDKNIVELHRIQIYLTSQSFHPTLNRHAASESRITSQVRHLAMKNKLLIFIITVSLLLHSLEPVILEDYPASSADGPFSIVVVGAVMRTISCVVSVTDIFREGGNPHSVYCFKQRFSNKSGDFLNDSVSISHIDVYAASHRSYTTSETFESFEGAGSPWAENEYRRGLLLNCKNFDRDCLIITILYKQSSQKQQ
jgi:hypothetical protein